jgi:hypothetical protein
MDPRKWEYNSENTILMRPGEGRVAWSVECICVCLKRDKSGRGVYVLWAEKLFCFRGRVPGWFWNFPTFFFDLFDDRVPVLVAPHVCYAHIITSASAQNWH